MKSYRELLAWLGVSLVSACSGGHDDASLSHYSAELTQSLDALEASASSHHREVLGQSGMAGVSALERDYVGEMNTCMSRLREDQQGIAQCVSLQTTTNHDGTWQHMHDADDAMGGMMTSTASEIARHTRAMGVTTSLAQALAEERTHRTTMNRLLDHMRTGDDDFRHAVQTAEGDGNSMMCSMMSGHMHH